MEDVPPPMKPGKLPTAGRELRLMEKRPNKVSCSEMVWSMRISPWSVLENWGGWRKKLRAMALGLPKFGKGTSPAIATEVAFSRFVGIVLLANGSATTKPLGPTARVAGSKMGVGTEEKLPARRAAGGTSVMELP